MKLFGMISIGAAMTASAPAAAQVSQTQQHNRCRAMQQQLIAVSRQPGFIVGVSEAQVAAMSAPVVTACVGQEQATAEIEGEVARLRRLVRWQRQMSRPRRVEAVGPHAHVRGDAVVCDNGMIPVLDGSVRLADRQQTTLYITCADDGTRAQRALDALMALVQPHEGESLEDAARRARQEFLAQAPAPSPAPQPQPGQNGQQNQQVVINIDNLANELGLQGIRDEVRRNGEEARVATRTANETRDELRAMQRRSGVGLGIGPRLTVFGSDPAPYSSSGIVGELSARLTGSLTEGWGWQIGGSGGAGDHMGQPAFQWTGTVGITRWFGPRYGLFVEVFVAGTNSLGRRDRERSSGFLGVQAGGQGGLVFAPFGARFRIRLTAGYGYGRVETGTRQNPALYFQGGAFVAAGALEYHLPY